MILSRENRNLIKHSTNKNEFLDLIDSLISKILEGDKKSLSKAISIAENDSGNTNLLLKKIFPHTGNAYRIGITGPPGAGKSSLTNCLAKLMTEKGLKIGIIAVDPTSPFTGGALLGDRVRMNEIGMLKNVFIRSMATRGSLGGLSNSVGDACEILDASGKDFIFIETVGVGQSELDIAKTADSTIVVLVPESGDAIQAMKAGLMEIADIFVLNKSDREGADGIAATIKNIIHLKPPSVDKWIIKVLKTVASQNSGIEKLLEEILMHKTHLIDSGFINVKRKNIYKNKILDLVNNNLQYNFWDNKRMNTLEESLEMINARQKDPYTFAEEMMKYK